VTKRVPDERRSSARTGGDHRWWTSCAIVDMKVVVV
jgi:hypothetical protein